ncbi:MAG TPA: calcium-binding protein, partial [Gammaproteobacteria bacterium]|nr:calcium-binding protein [Gammaproteobacteria bacterium]
MAIEIVLTRGDDNFTAPDTDDRIQGKGGNDIINGSGGDDEIYGDDAGAGLFVNDGRDTLHGNAGDDILHGGGDNDILFGDADADTLFGDLGNDTLNGGTGNDTMKGGSGDDTYVVDSLGDVVDDVVLGGTDQVNSFISYNLSDAHYVENLTLIGFASISGTGDDHDNVITGNNNNNRLDGGGGSDSLYGQGGNDTFVINANSGDDAIIDGGADTDTVESSISFSLASTTNVENLTLTGSPGNPAINGT